MMQHCDTLLMIGSSFPYSEFLPKEGTARGVQIELDPKMLSIRYPMEVPLVGDSAETLRALIPLLQPKSDRSWRESIDKNIAEWWKVLEAQAMNSANPINPQRVFWELSPRLPDNCILTADSGSCANWYARDLKMRRGMMATLSGTLATMGPGVPYAIAAKFAWPDRVAIAFVGNGAMLMNGNNELVTIAENWKSWSDPRLIILVLANHDLNMVSWEQRIMNGDPKFEPSQTFPPSASLVTPKCSDSKAFGWISPNKSARLGMRLWPQAAPSSSKPSLIPKFLPCLPISRWSRPCISAKHSSTMRTAPGCYGER
jgi:pyruvate dehydrogenase (quinone)